MLPPDCITTAAIAAPMASEATCEMSSPRPMMTIAAPSDRMPRTAMLLSSVSAFWTVANPGINKAKMPARRLAPQGDVGTAAGGLYPDFGRHESHSSRDRRFAFARYSSDVATNASCNWTKPQASHAADVVLLLVKHHLVTNSHMQAGFAASREIGSGDSGISSEGKRETFCAASRRKFLHL